MRDIDNHPGLLRIYEAAREPDVSESTPRRWLLRGKLEGLKIEGVVCVESRSIEKLPRTDRYADVRETQQRSISLVARFMGSHCSEECK
jgi:hypothetical protein